MEATHLTCSIHVKNFEEQCRFFGPEGLGFEVTNEFGMPDGRHGRFHQTGAGFVEVVEYPDEPEPSWDFILSVENVPAWRDRLEGRGYHPGEIEDMPAGRVGFRTVGPSGVRFRVRSLSAGDEPLGYAKSTTGPNVLHFIVTWWPGPWEQDHELFAEGLGLVTAAGRSEPGRRIAFLRAAYGGRGALELIEPRNESHEGDGLRWRMGLMVDDAGAFHRRLEAAGFPVSPLDTTEGSLPAFITGTSAGPEVRVAQVPEGVIPGLLASPGG